MVSISAEAWWLVMDALDEKYECLKNMTMVRQNPMSH